MGAQTLPQEMKRSGLEVGHSPPYHAKLRMSGAKPLLLLYAFYSKVMKILLELIYC
jgi:hypothetical protein